MRSRRTLCHWDEFISEHCTRCSGPHFNHGNLCATIIIKRIIINRIDRVALLCMQIKHQTYLWILWLMWRKKWDIFELNCRCDELSRNSIFPKPFRSSIHCIQCRYIWKLILGSAHLYAYFVPLAFRRRKKQQLNAGCLYCQTWLQFNLPFVWANSYDVMHACVVHKQTHAHHIITCILLPHNIYIWNVQPI